MAGALSENFREIRGQIADACSRAGRSPDEVRLIAVSKTKPVETIRLAMNESQKEFGENYVQELKEKVLALPDADFHFIGSLQTNKVKDVVGKVSLIHSVDRLKLAQEIAKQAEKVGVVQDILLQIQIGDESTKHGSSLDEAKSTIESLQDHSGVRIAGLMSLPPLTESEAQARAWFAELRESLESLKSGFSREKREQFSELSMGTSGDFKWAILEGATMVRVGTSLFGARESKR